MKLYKYKGYNAQNNNIIHGWENKEPFIYTDEVFSDYVDIHTIVGMYNNGSKLFNFNQQRIIISGLFYEKAGTSLQNYGTLTDNEKFIGSQLLMGRILLIGIF
jgi:archaellum component FlaF (FlaF/FlaG flagellin family)